MKNRYLAGLPLGQGRSRRNLVNGGFWILVVVLALALSTYAGNPLRGPAMLPLIVLSIIGLACLFVVFRLQRGSVTPVVSAEMLALRERYDEAVAALRALLPRTSGYARYRALSALAACASARGDFLEGAQVYAMAARGVTGALARQLAPGAHANAAFLLAAAGRVDEAERALAESVPSRTTMSGTRALLARARALILARRGQHAELLAHLDAERVPLRNSLGRRDRMLLRILQIRARGEVGAIAVDPEIARWLSLVLPDHAALWEAA